MIKNWIKGTGSYKISEETTGTVLVPPGTKYLENTTAGTTAIQSKQAYGTWEFDWYKGADGNTSKYYIINSTPNNATGQGYVFYVDNSEQALLRRNNVGVETSIVVTANSYVANNTWYRTKVARLASAGVFKDIPTLQTSDCVNHSYTTFTSGGRYGFSVTGDGSITHRAGTVDEISIVNGVKYLVEFDLKLNSGTAPSFQLADTLTSGALSSLSTTTNGRNSVILTATGTATGVILFANISTASDYKVSGLTIRRIYDTNTFAVFIKGGAFGTNNWTLIPTTGGSGSNPVTDSTYTTSNYFVADLDAGDRITNIKIKDGVEQ